MDAKKDHVFLYLRLPAFFSIQNFKNLPFDLIITFRKLFQRQKNLKMSDNLAKFFYLGLKKTAEVISFVQQSRCSVQKVPPSFVLFTLVAQEERTYHSFVCL